MASRTKYLAEFAEMTVEAQGEQIALLVVILAAVGARAEERAEAAQDTRTDAAQSIPNAGAMLAEGAPAAAVNRAA